MAAVHSEIKATNIHFHPGTVTREERSKLTKNQGAIVWLTGLSACGKSTIAVALEQVLIQRGHVAYVLDGDNIRFGLNKNLGFSPEDRTENIRRIGEVAKLFADSGAIAIASFISPYKADRDNVRALAAGEKPVKPVHFIEVFVDAPLDVCEKRDPKGLYKKARAALAEGKPMQFTGVDAPYEAPTSPELVVKSAEVSVERAVAEILDLLGKKHALLG